MRTPAIKVRKTKVSTRPLPSTRSNTCIMYNGDVRTKRLIAKLNAASTRKPARSARNASVKGVIDARVITE